MFSTLLRLMLASCALALWIGAATAQQRKCPANAHPDGEDARNYYCTCDKGFKPIGNACIPIPQTTQSIENIWGEPVTPIAGADRSGMLVEHVTGLIRFCQEKSLLMIFRASNLESKRYYNDPNFVAKPKIMEMFHTADPGKPYAGIVVGGDGQPIKYNGKLVHADYDMQGVYQRGDSGGFKKVYTDPQASNFVKELNDRLFAKKPMIQHGDNDGYAPIPKDPKDIPLLLSDMRRFPGADEKFLIIEPDGKTRIVEGASNLKGYYGAKKIFWPYR